MIINQKQKKDNSPNSGLSRKRKQKIDKYLELARELNMQWKMKLSMIPIALYALGERFGRFGDCRSSRNYPNPSIVKISQSSKKSPEDLRRLAVTQSRKKDYQLTLV